MMGRPDLCQRKRDWSAVNTAVIDAVNVIRDNSCVKQRLIELLEGQRETPSELLAPVPPKPQPQPPPPWSTTVNPPVSGGAGP
jgi:hypothetical protein